MKESEVKGKKEQMEQKEQKEHTRKDQEAYSEIDEMGHERNEVAAAQKEMSSQETAGVFD